MKVLIAYSTKYGTAERVAGMFCEKVALPCDVVNLRTTPTPAIAQYDVVILGGPIYAGRMRREVPKFADRYRQELLQRQVGVFISCLYEGEQAEQQLQDNLPAWLLAHAFGRYKVGGVVEYRRLGLVDRLIMQKIAGVSADIDRLDHHEISRMIEDVDSLSRGS